MGFEARRGEISRRIGRSWFFIEAVANGDEVISDLLHEISAAGDVETLEQVWERFYVWADENSVHVDTDPKED